MRGLRLGSRRAKNTAAASELLPFGGRVETAVVDVADRAAVESCFEATLKSFDRVDGMFANAGVSSRGRVPFAERGPEEWRRMLSINLEGAVACLQVAARHMTARAKAGDPFGRLVATSSVASVDGAAFNEHYGATKGALNAIIRAIAVELARWGVTANAILPGWIESAMTADILGNEKFVGAVLPRIPARRFGTPGDFGGIATYLMSDLSAYHTGQVFVIDGGYTIF